MGLSKPNLSNVAHENVQPLKYKNNFQLDNFAIYVIYISTSGSNDQVIVPIQSMIEMHRNCRCKLLIAHIFGFASYLPDWRYSYPFGSHRAHWS